MLILKIESICAQPVESGGAMDFGISAEVVLLDEGEENDWHWL